MKKEESSIGKILRWIGMAFLWGMGILFFYTCIEAMNELIRSWGGSWWIAFGVYTAMGAIAMSIYNKCFK